jgi:hypothetical protein
LVAWLVPCPQWAMIRAQAAAKIMAKELRAGHKR